MQLLFRHNGVHMMNRIYVTHSYMHVSICLGQHKYIIWLMKSYFFISCSAYTATRFIFTLLQLFTAHYNVFLQTFIHTTNIWLMFNINKSSNCQLLNLRVSSEINNKPFQKYINSYMSHSSYTITMHHKDETSTDELNS